MLALITVVCLRLHIRTFLFIFGSMFIASLVVMVGFMLAQAIVQIACGIGNSNVETVSFGS